MCFSYGAHAMLRPPSRLPWTPSQARNLNRNPKPEWRASIQRAAHWIRKKRVKKEEGSPHSGLLPAGFSAEHLGPNDFYYWDDFWSIAGLRSAARLMRLYGETQEADGFEREAQDLMQCVELSLEHAQNRLGHTSMPASPTRRMDAGAIGSLAAGYPLQLWPAQDPRPLATARYLTRNCYLKGAFYQEISHSGMNAYLTLHVAQVLLRAGDPAFLDAVNAVAAIASPTGQWPEAVHPLTGGGCMGDGQHVWAAAEWVLMLRNMFVREDGDNLVLCQGIPQAWLKKGQKILFGPTQTSFGPVTVTIHCEETPRVSWKADWHHAPASIEVKLGEAK